MGQWLCRPYHTNIIDEYAVPIVKPLDAQPTKDQTVELPTQLTYFVTVAEAVKDSMPGGVAIPNGKAPDPKPETAVVANGSSSAKVPPAGEKREAAKAPAAANGHAAPSVKSPPEAPKAPAPNGAVQQCCANCVIS